RSTPVDEPRGHHRQRDPPAAGGPRRWGGRGGDGPGVRHAWLAGHRDRSRGAPAAPGGALRRGRAAAGGRRPAGRGADWRAGDRATAVRRDGRAVIVTLSDGQQIRGEEILVAAGRRPRTQDLGLETVGLRPGAAVEVDDRLAVPGLPWLYAIGDVNGRSLL